MRVRVRVKVRMRVRDRVRARVRDRVRDRARARVRLAAHAAEIERRKSFGAIVAEALKPFSCTSLPAEACQVTSPRRCSASARLVVPVEPKPPPSTSGLARGDGGPAVSQMACLLALKPFLCSSIHDRSVGLLTEDASVV